MVVGRMKFRTRLTKIVSEGTSSSARESIKTTVAIHRDADW